MINIVEMGEGDIFVLISPIKLTLYTVAMATILATYIVLGKMAVLKRAVVDLHIHTKCVRLTSPPPSPLGVCSDRNSLGVLGLT